MAVVAPAVAPAAAVAVGVGAASKPELREAAVAMVVVTAVVLEWVVAQTVGRGMAAAVWGDRGHTLAAHRSHCNLCQAHMHHTKNLGRRRRSTRRWYTRRDLLGTHRCIRTRGGMRGVAWLVGWAADSAEPEAGCIVEARRPAVRRWCQRYHMRRPRRRNRKLVGLAHVRRSHRRGPLLHRLCSCHHPQLCTSTPCSLVQTAVPVVGKAETPPCTVARSRRSRCRTGSRRWMRQSTHHHKPHYQQSLDHHPGTRWSTRRPYKGELMVAWAGREAMVQTVVAGETGAAAAKEESAWLTCVERGTRRLRKRSIARALAPKLTAEKLRSCTQFIKFDGATCGTVVRYKCSAKSLHGGALARRKVSVSVGIHKEREKRKVRTERRLAIQCSPTPCFTPSCSPVTGSRPISSRP